MVDSYGKTGLRVFGSTSRSPLGAMNLDSMGGKGKLIMLEDPRQYNSSQM